MGFEILTQPQIFVSPVTATQGIVGVNEAYPLLTSRQAWVTSGVVNATEFPIPGSWSMLSDSASFIVSVGGVVQAPTNYIVNANTRKLTFSEPVSADIEVSVTQLATHAPSTVFFDTISANNVFFVNLTAANINTETINSHLLTATNLITTYLTALTAVIDTLDIRMSELSGFFVNGNVYVTQSLTANNITALTAFNAISDIVYSNVNRLSGTTAQFTNLTAVNFYTTSLTADNIVGINSNYTNLSTLNLSAQNLHLFNVFGNDIIGNINTLVFPNSGTKVGIGTTQPNHALTVVGSISTTELNANLINADTLEFTTAFGPFIPEYFYLTSDSPLGVVGASAFSIFNEELPILFPNKQYLLDYYVSFSYTDPSTNRQVQWNLSAIPNTDPAWEVIGGDVIHSGSDPAVNSTVFVIPLSSNQNTQLCLQPYQVNRFLRHYFKASLVLALTGTDTEPREIDLGMRMNSTNVTSFIVHRGSYWRLTRIS